MKSQRNILYIFFPPVALDYGVPLTQPVVQTSILPTHSLLSDPTIPSTWQEVTYVAQRFLNTQKNVEKLVLTVNGWLSAFKLKCVCVCCSFQWNESPKVIGASAKLAWVDPCTLLHLGHTKQRLSALLAQQLKLTDCPDCSTILYLFLM